MNIDVLNQIERRSEVADIYFNNSNILLIASTASFYIPYQEFIDLVMALLEIVK